MRKDDILKLPSMPASGPSYPAGPYRFIDREFMVITYETDPDIIRHQLPEPISMYGGGFATIPAYLRDLFGTHNVSAIHGRLLTAWSTAGVLGPVLVNYMREYQIQHGADKASAYQSVLHFMAALLVVGFIANLLVRPVAQKYWMDSKWINLKSAWALRTVRRRFSCSPGFGSGFPLPGESPSRYKTH